MKSSKLGIFGVLLSLGATSPGVASDDELFDQLKELQGEVQVLSTEFRETKRAHDKQEMGERLREIMLTSYESELMERNHFHTSDVSFSAFMGLVLLGTAWFVLKDH